MSRGNSVTEEARDLQAPLEDRYPPVQDVKFADHHPEGTLSEKTKSAFSQMGENLKESFSNATESVQKFVGKKGDTDTGDLSEQNMGSDRG